MNFIKSILQKIATIGENYDVVKSNDVSFTYISWNVITRRYYVCVYTYATNTKNIVSKGFTVYDLAKQYAEKY